MGLVLLGVHCLQHHYEHAGRFSYLATMHPSGI